MITLSLWLMNANGDFIQKKYPESHKTITINNANGDCALDAAFELKACDTTQEF